MPNGYTYPIIQGDGISFEEFVLSCCLAFGACIMQRDDSPGSKPRLQEPSDYHLLQVEKARAEHARLSAMSKPERMEFGRQKIADAIESCQSAMSKQRDEDARLAAMLATVRRWNPPTDDHKGLKDFMVEQLAGSMRGPNESWSGRIESLREADPLALWHEAVSSVQSDIIYHTDHYAEEVERVAGRNKWIMAVYESLGISPEEAKS